MRRLKKRKQAAKRKKQPVSKVELAFIIAAMSFISGMEVQELLAAGKAS